MAGEHPLHAIMSKLHGEHPTLASFFQSDPTRDVTSVSVRCEHRCTPRQMRELSWEAVRCDGEEIVREMLRAIPCEHLKEPPKPAPKTVKNAFYAALIDARARIQRDYPEMTIISCPAAPNCFGVRMVCLGCTGLQSLAHEVMFSEAAIEDAIDPVTMMEGVLRSRIQQAFRCEHVRKPSGERLEARFTVPPIQATKAPHVIVYGNPFVDGPPRMRMRQALDTIEKSTREFSRQALGEFGDEEKTNPRIELDKLTKDPASQGYRSVETKSAVIVASVVITGGQRSKDIGAMLVARYGSTRVHISVQREHPNLVNSLGHMIQGVWARLSCALCSADCGVSIRDEADANERVRELFSMFETGRSCSHGRMPQLIRPTAEDLAPAKTAYPETAAQMQTAVGCGNWTAGYFLNEAAGSLSAAIGNPSPEPQAVTNAVRDFMRAIVATFISPIVAAASTFHDDEPIARVDGVGVEELLRRYTENQREGRPVYGMAGPDRWEFTPAQLLMTKHLWSVEVKKRTRASDEADRNQVRVEVQDID